MNISVIVPLYNKKDTIRRTIESVRKQNFPPQEIVVVNDGSTDGSEKIVASMGVPELKIINQQNTGVSTARNKGVEEAQCEWIAFLDGDDEWMPGFLYTIKEMHFSFPAYEVYATAYLTGDYTGATRQIVLNRIPFKGSAGVLDNYFEVASTSDPPFCSSAVCINKNALNDIGGFPSNIKSGEDLVTWARLACRLAPVYCIHPFSVFWQDKGYTYDDKPSRVPEHDDPVGKTLLELKKDKSQDKPFIEKYISHWHKIRASVYLRLGMRWKATVECCKGLYYSPMNYKLIVYLILSTLPDFMVRQIIKLFGR